MGAFPSAARTQHIAVQTTHSHLAVNANPIGRGDVVQMAATFGEPTAARCQHYAGFASHLSRQHFDGIYWTLFVFVIFMLFAASWNYNSSVERASNHEPGSSELKRIFKKCLYVCTLYSAMSVVAVVMEVFALLALQFCEGEDLMSLYWSTWTVMQVGGLIAIFGIMLAAVNQIRGNKNPPWALALGTPVLVVAGLGHALHGSMKKRVKKVRSQSRRRSRSRGRSRGNSTSELPVSRDDTLRGEDSEKDDPPPPREYNAKLVGYTCDGAPIIQFQENPGDIGPDRCDTLGRNADGLVTVAFKKKFTVVSPRGESSKEDETAGSGSDPEKADVAEVEAPRTRVVRIQSPEPLTPFSPFSNSPTTPLSANSVANSTTNLNLNRR